MAAPVRRLDASGDWTFGRGQASYLTGQAAIGQRVRSTLRLFYAEFFADISAGVPYTVPEGSDVQPILGVPFNRSYTEAVIANAVLGCDGVASIESVVASMDTSTRQGEVTVDLIDETGAALSITEAFP